MEQPFYACEHSQQVNEPFFATAPRAETWILLEYPRPWSAEAYPASDIPTGVKAHIDAQIALMPFPRIQLIARSHNQSELANLSLYVIHAGFQSQRVRHFTLPTYENLRDLPLAEIAAGEREQGEIITEPVYIVCTNGKRDVCCSRHGLGLFNALREHGGEHVWQSNHIGGHRFAGTLVTFPYGLYYGRVAPEDVTALANATARGKVLLSHVRGRACLESVIQAAEYYLHRESGQMALDAFMLCDVEPADKHWHVWFERGTQRYQVTVGKVMSSFEIFADSASSEKKPVPEYPLIGFETLRQT